MPHEAHVDQLLVVGDGSLAATRTFRVLEGGRFRVLMAETLSEAQEMLSTAELAAVLIVGDQQARNVTLLDRIRAAGLPVVVLTHVDDPAFEATMRKHGARECVRHGVLRDDQLARSMHVLIESHRAIDAATALKDTLKATSRRLSRLRGRRQQALDALLADVREPTYEILTQTELLLRELRGPLNDEQKGSLVTLRDAARRLARLSDGILDVSEEPQRQPTGSE